MKLIILDCDGTIVDSQNAIVSAMEYAFGACGLASPSRQAVLDIVGLSLGEAFQLLAPDASPGEQNFLANHYRDAFRHLHDDPAALEPLYEGALEVLETLSEREDILLGIATGKSLRGVERLFAREGFGDWFITVQTADTHPSKPHPAMIAAAMGETGAAPDRTVMIGDTTYDIEMAMNANVAALGVSWGYHPASALKEAGADRVIDAWEDMIGTIDELLV